MKLFRLLGVSERQGFGGPLIYKVAMQNDYKRPEILTNIERTELKVWNIDLVDAYPDLASDDKNVFRYIVKSSQAQSVNAIKKALDMTEYRVWNSLKTLEDEELIKRIGNGTSTKYTIGIESVEFLTQMQMAMDILKKQMN